MTCATSPCPVNYQAVCTRLPGTSMRVEASSTRKVICDPAFAVQVAPSSSTNTVLSATVAALVVPLPISVI